MELAWLGRLLGLGRIKVITLGAFTAVDLTPAAGTFVPAFIVPQKVTWRVLYFDKDGTTGTTTLAARIAGVISRLANGQTAFNNYTGNPFILSGGDALGILSGGNAGDSSRGSYAIVEEYRV